MMFVTMILSACLDAAKKIHVQFQSSVDKNVGQIHNVNPKINLTKKDAALRHFAPE